MSDAQAQWAELLIASLVDAGVRDAVISPGSRSTPLVWAATHALGLRCRALIDERSAAFFALGQARVTGMPSVLICTSGTAPAHYYPAVIEAKESGTPLIVLSADRPFEAQYCSAPQTIDQVRLFGSHAHYYELGTPIDSREALVGLRRMAWQAVASCLEPPRVPVHLNFRARKPLEPRDRAPLPTLPGSRRRALRRSAGHAPRASDVERLVATLRQSACPLLICGAMSVHEAPPAELVRRFIELSGAVVLPEAVSQLRFQVGGAHGAGVVCDAYEWSLGQVALRADLQPDFALQIGAVPVSGALAQLLEAAELEYTICAESGWPDPLHGAASIVRSAPAPLLEACCQALERRPPPARPRVGHWRAADELARRVVARHLAVGFGEAVAVHTLLQHVPDGSVLAVGNSLPPRLLDRYCAASARGIRVCSQRGANGIEGGIAGALGAASRAGAATTLLLGDISFFHDVGSLWAAAVPSRATEHPVVIVVLNNAGGRIFEQLPVARCSDVDLDWWTTPHELDLGGAARLYGVAYDCVRGRDELARALGAAYRRIGVTLVEVVVEPDNAARSLSAVQAELERELRASPLSTAS